MGYRILKRVLTVKIGGSVFSDKSKPYSFREKSVEKLAELFSYITRDNTVALVLVLGGGSHGHVIVKQLLETHGRLEKRHVPIISRVMERLALRFAGVLEERGLAPLIVHPHNICYAIQGQHHCDLSIAAKAIEDGIPVITYGDAILSDTGAYILSGDDLTVDLALLTKTPVLFYLSNVNGIRDVNGEVIPEATLKELVENNTLGGASGIDVTGGMRKKVESLSRLPPGTKVCIANGLDVQGVKEALLGGRCPGTLIHV